MNVSERLSEKNPSPVESASFLSKFTFWWATDLFRKGLKGPLNSNDLYDTKSNLRSECITNAYEKSWMEEVAKRKSPSLLRVMFKHHGKALLFWGILYSMTESSMRYI